jgi:hypothetical protein
MNEIIRLTISCIEWVVICTFVTGVNSFVASGRCYLPSMLSNNRLLSVHASSGEDCPALGLPGRLLVAQGLLVAVHVDVGVDEALAVALDLHGQPAVQTHGPHTPAHVALLRGGGVAQSAEFNQHSMLQR